MSENTELSRRGFLKAILACGVAPAFIKADSLMKLVVPSKEIVLPNQINYISDTGLPLSSYSFGEKVGLLTIEQITNESLRALENVLVSLKGSTINVRLPARFTS